MFCILGRDVLIALRGFCVKKEIFNTFLREVGDYHALGKVVGVELFIW